MLNRDLLGYVYGEKKLLQSTWGSDYHLISLGMMKKEKYFWPREGKNIMKF